MAKNVTLRDIARIHGVSVNTVSHALRDMPDIGEQTRREIQQTARDLGYRVNLAARSLRTNRTHTLGVIITDIANPFFAEMIKGIEYACQSIGYTILVANTDEDPERERDAVETMTARSTDGVIMIPTMEGTASVGRLQSAGIPLVMLYRRLEGVGAHRVTSDEVTGGMLAARHLWEKGHRRLCYITAPLRVSSAAERLEGIRRYLGAQGADQGRLFIRETDFTWRGGYRAMHDLLAGGTDVTAVVGYSDFLAAGILRALHERGARVPRDMAVMGFDGTPMGELVTPALTTIDIRAFSLGQKAVGMLMDVIRSSKDPEPRLLVSEPRLVVRNST